MKIKVAAAKASRRHTQGFTLLEIMTVVAIISFIAAMGLPAILRSIDKSQTTAKDRNIVDVEKAKGRYQLNELATNGQGIAFTDIDPYLTGVDALSDLDVGGNAITINPLGTTASY